MNKIKITRSIWFRILRKIFWANNVVRFFTRPINDELFIKANYWWTTLQKLDINNPKLYTEKLQWVNKNCKDRRVMMCSDKLLVRDYIIEKLGQERGNEILNTLHYVYSDPDEIDFNSLPVKCVLKANHGSGWNLIIKDKNEINWNAAKNQMKRWMRSNYYCHNREYQYKNMVPKILCEAFLENDDGSEIWDYKFMCFNGEPIMLWIDYDRNTKHIRNFYDLEGNPLYYESDVSANYNVPFEKPENYERMVEIARCLSKPFPHVRIDLYNINGRIIFGEMTFTSWGGFVLFKTPELNNIWGNRFSISNTELNSTN